MQGTTHRQPLRVALCKTIIWWATQMTATSAVTSIREQTIQWVSQPRMSTMPCKRGSRGSSSPENNTKGNTATTKVRNIRAAERREKASISRICQRHLIWRRDKDRATVMEAATQVGYAWALSRPIRLIIWTRWGRIITRCSLLVNNWAAIHNRSNIIDD